MVMVLLLMLMFRFLSDFLKWKSNFEKDTGSCYVRNWRKSSGKEGTLFYYDCKESGMTQAKTDKKIPEKVGTWSPGGKNYINILLL
jgi:hypothetical protein